MEQAIYEQVAGDQSSSCFVNVYIPPLINDFPGRFEDAKDELVKIVNGNKQWMYFVGTSDAWIGMSRKYNKRHYIKTNRGWMSHLKVVKKWTEREGG